MRTRELAEALWAMVPPAPDAVAYTGEVRLIVRSQTGVSSVSVLPQGASTPVQCAASGAFAAEVSAGDAARIDLVGRTVLVWKINNQAHVAYTIGGS